MALGIGYGLPFVAQHGTNPYKTQWSAALEGAKGAGASVEDENAGTGSCLVSRGQDVYTDGLPFTPSLLIVPQFYKAGNLYQDVPPFVAEDTTMRFTVSRNTTATRVNSSGLIESVASGVPRIDWLGQSCPALLVEASGQNLVQRSEDFNNNYWSKVNCVVSGDLAIAPDGNLTADKLIMNNGILPNAANQSGFNRSETITSGTYRFSVFAKAAEFTGFKVRENLTTGAFLDVNLTNGAITNGDVTQFINPLAENYGNGWYRISWTSPTITSLTKYSIRVGSTGDGTSGIFVWGAQVETGSVATTYIPTTTAAVSRADDVISASGALVSGLIGQTEGTIYCEFTFLGTPASRSGPIYLRQGSLRGMGINFAPTDSPSGIRFSSRNNAGTTNINIVSGALQIGTFYKVAIAYDAAGTAAGGTQASGVVAYVNGVQTNIGTLQVPDSAGLTEIRMYGANSGDDNEAFNGRIRAAALYTTRLSNDQLAELTRL